MPIDDWKREQDSARAQWVQNRTGQCNEVERKWQCDQIEKKWQCDQIEKKWQCNQVEKKWQCDVQEEKKACASWSKWVQWLCITWSYVKTGVCLVGKWVETGICLAGQWVETGLCLAGRWIETGFCIAGRWIETGVCKAETWVVDKVWAAGSWIAWGAGKIVEKFTGSELSRQQPQPPDLVNLLPFPRDFLWGVSTSAYQVEGNITENDWNIFTTSDAIKRRVKALSSKVGRAYELEPAGEAVHHGNLEVLKADLDRARLLGMNAYRFSIEWSRIQPTLGSVDQAALDYYQNAIEEMHRRGLKPIVTLNHFALPKWVLMPPRESSFLSAIGYPIAIEDDEFKKSLRGWENEATIEAFLGFVLIVVGTFLNQVDTWITLNEPVGSMIGVGYIGGIWPPGFNLDGDRAKKAYFNILKAHVKAYRLIKSLYGNKPSSVGIVHAMLYAKVTGKASPGGTGAEIGAAAGALLGGLVGLIVGGPLGAVAGAVIGGGAGAGVGAVVGAASDEHLAARNQFDYFYNYHLLDSLTKGQVDKAINRREPNREYEDARSFFDIPSTEQWKPQLDFIGLNYYRSVYVSYNQILATGIPGIVAGAGFSGGAFTNDLNNGDEKHNLLNDLGWEICPQGLYLILTEGLANNYHLPILITENGIPEYSDRNRAAYTIAHLQHVRAAMRDGADVRGYIHWSLLDNWELQEGYRDDSKFGLFTVDFDADLQQSGEPSFPRHITEGAVGLQHLIANDHHITEINAQENPFNETVARFGTISAWGAEVQPPGKMPGALWEGRFPGKDGSPFMLYISRLSCDGWLGMIFLQDEHRWVRIQDIQWRARPNRDGQPTGYGSLSFRYPIQFSSDVFVDYTAETTNLENASNGVTLQGVITVSRTDRHWIARRMTNTGIWKQVREGQAPELIALNRLEGDYDRWNARYFSQNRNWASGGLITWNGSNVRIEVQKITDLKMISGLVQNDTMSATITRLGRYGEYDVKWEGKKLLDDIPF